MQTLRSERAAGSFDCALPETRPAQWLSGVRRPPALSITIKSEQSAPGREPGLRSGSRSQMRKESEQESNNLRALVIARAPLSIPARLGQSGFQKTLSAHLRARAGFQANRHAPQDCGTEGAR